MNNNNTPIAAVQTHAEHIKKRIASIDIMRGIVMLIMLLDHTRERFMYHNQVSNPMDLSDTSTEMFFTRTLAHLCAPTFVFLTGLSAWLYSHPANKPYRSPTSFLVKRGLFLIFIEIALVNYSWLGSYDVLYLQIIWTIGVCMVLLGLLVHANYWVIGAVGFGLLFFNRLLDPISFEAHELGYSLWTILHDGGWLVENGPVQVRAGGFPVLGWFGVMCLGYFIGPLFSKNANSDKRQKVLFISGVAALALIAFLRGFNIAGEELPWVVGNDWLESFKSMINFSKYPPSLGFMLLTLGFMLLILAALERVNNRVSQVVESFGSAPMFFYILHLYVLLVAYAVLEAVFGATKVKDFGWNQGMYYGFDSVGQIWLATTILAVLLYFPTKAFSDYKKRTTVWWVKYL
ncbi:DUF1624 domain-containing protein [Shewanella maritima]|uniref:DUF1624 domain-containing protein n=1 Tax=Shewanella maritima TaxID=2520507 RepID=A0A411PK51_9GAMM|nr:heparan-alpha-glucosaminide N-acetyltransferase domain-containing protein [Shewanella maritima]QBF83802.1 DUF1624 domain-containing protein [Shewanella maritima]